MSQKGLEVRVGLFTALAIVLLTVGVIWGRDVRLGSDYRILHFRFSNSDGLRSGDPVTVNGVKKGRVQEVVLTGRTVTVTTLLEPDVVLYEGFAASIGMLDVMGSQKLELQPGEGSHPLDFSHLPDTLEGGKGTGMASLFADVQSMQTQAVDLLNESRDLLTNLKQLTDQKTVIAPVHASIRDFAASASALRQLVDGNQQRIENSLRDFESAAGAAANLLSETRTPLTESLQRMNSMLVEMDTLSAALGTVAMQLHKREGTVARLIYEDETYDHLQRSISNVDSLTQDLRRHLGRYLQGSQVNLLNFIKL